MQCHRCPGSTVPSPLPALNWLLQVGSRGQSRSGAPGGRRRGDHCGARLRRGGASDGGAREHRWPSSPWPFPFFRHPLRCRGLWPSSRRPTGLHAVTRPPGRHDILCTGFRFASPLCFLVSKPITCFPLSPTRCSWQITHWSCDVIPQHHLPHTPEPFTHDAGPPPIPSCQVGASDSNSIFNTHEPNLIPSPYRPRRPCCRHWSRLHQCQGHPLARLQASRPQLHYHRPPLLPLAR